MKRIMTPDRKWIMLNEARRNLQKILNWTASVEGIREDILEAIRLIEEAQEKLEQHF